MRDLETFFTDEGALPSLDTLAGELMSIQCWRWETIQILSDLIVRTAMIKQPYVVSRADLRYCLKNLQEILDAYDEQEATEEHETA